LQLKRELGLFGVCLDKPSVHEALVARLVEDCLVAAQESQLFHKPSADRVRLAVECFARHQISSDSTDKDPFLDALQIFNDDRRAFRPEWIISTAFAEAFWQPAQMCWELVTDCWSRLPLATRWMSMTESDLEMGAHGIMAGANWVGKNGLVAIHPYGNLSRSGAGGGRACGGRPHEVCDGSPLLY
jgi:hypothetical protein